MYKDIAKLRYQTETADADGFPVIATVETEVFIDVKSVKRTEYYKAMQSGMELSIVFELRTVDYDLTEHFVAGKHLYADSVEYDSQIYDIIRTYKPNDEIIELICS